MTTRKFLTSVADVFGYDQNDNLLFTGKTLLDSSIEVSMGSSPVRGGRGNQLQYIYYHTGEMKINLTETQWNLAMLAYAVGSTPTFNSNSVYMEENVQAHVTSTTATATVTGGTPLTWEALTTSPYGWATTPEGHVIRGTFSSTTWTGSTVGTDLTDHEYICLRYYRANSAAESLTISANIIPATVKLVMEAQLNSADVSTNKIGIVQIIVPTAALSGGFSISMKADGVTNTPLSATASAYTPVTADTTPCTEEPYYAKIFEIIDNANWYDNVIGLSIQEGDFSLTTGGSSTLIVWAIPSSGAPFVPPVADLDFTSSGTGVATVSAAGVVAAVGPTGTSTIVVKGDTGTTINDIEASCVVTVA